MSNQEIAIYQPNSETSLPFRREGDQVFGSQKEIASLFGISISSVKKHAENFNDADPEAYSKGVEKFSIPSAGGVQSVVHYNLDIITYIGYRAQATPQTIAFRRWVATLIKQSIQPTSIGDNLVAMATAFRALEQKVDRGFGDIAQSIEAINARLDNAEYFTVEHYCKAQGIRTTPALNQKRGKDASALSRARGIQIREIPVEGYSWSSVHIYHQSVLAEVCSATPRQTSDQLKLPEN